MLVTLMVTLCLASGQCKDVNVSETTLDRCQFAIRDLPVWLDENGYTAKGYTLKSWGCQIGERRRVI